MPLKTPDRHRNITLTRLLLDACQFVRAQSFVSGRFGRQFLPSRSYAEIDITYQCNLKCINCNRSCTQAPSNREMPVADIEAFIEQSIEKQIDWKRIRILGGEPTLHSRIFDIIDLLINYQQTYNPSVRLVLGTNFFGNHVHRVLEQLPDGITLKSTLKSSRVNLFKPFNVAPVDTWFNRFSNYACGGIDAFRVLYVCHCRWDRPHRWLSSRPESAAGRIRHVVGPDVRLLPFMRSFWLPVADTASQAIQNVAVGLSSLKRDGIEAG